MAGEHAVDFLAEVLDLDRLGAISDRTRPKDGVYPSEPERCINPNIFFCEGAEMKNRIVVLASAGMLLLAGLGGALSLDKAFCAVTSKSQVSMGLPASITATAVAESPGQIPPPVEKSGCTATTSCPTSTGGSTPLMCTGNNTCTNAGYQVICDGTPHSCSCWNLVPCNPDPECTCNCWAVGGSRTTVRQCVLNCNLAC